MWRHGHSCAHTQRLADCMEGFPHISRLQELTVLHRDVVHVLKTALQVVVCRLVVCAWRNQHLHTLHKQFSSHCCNTWKSDTRMWRKYSRLVWCRKAVCMEEWAFQCAHKDLHTTQKAVLTLHCRNTWQSLHLYTFTPLHLTVFFTL